MRTKNLLRVLVLLPVLCLTGKLFSQGIYNSASVVISGAPTITIRDGGFHNNNQFIPGSGTVMLIGTSAIDISTLGGSHPTPFFHLTIGKTAGDASLSGDISVDGNLTMQSGNLDLNTHTIDLGSGGGQIINESNTARIMGATGGTLLKTADLNAPAGINPGNIGIAISSTANLGITLIRRGHQQPTSPGGGLGIERYFDIIPANNSSLNATLQMFYLDNELAGIAKGELNFYKSENAGASWSFIGKDNNDEINDWVLKNNIDQLSRWALASNISNPLPLTLLSFTGRLDNGQTLLQWTTAQEENSSYFEVQRSTDGSTFSPLFRVAATGTTTAATTYHGVDPTPVPGSDYYRLKEVDLDGHFTYSPVVRLTVTFNNSLTTWPNPVTQVVYLNIQVEQPCTDKIGLYDINGRLIQEKAVQLGSGNNLLQWDLGRLARGVYTLHSKKLFSAPVKIIKL